METITRALASFALLAGLFAAHSAAAAPEEYGMGVLCPRADSQVIFYTENDQQDAAGTIAYETGGGFIVTSDTVKDLKSAGASVMESVCDGGMTGIRIDSKRDGWLQAGKLWLPPNQEWDYGDWQDFLHKAAVWKPLGVPTLYQGTQDAPARDKPYAEGGAKVTEIYPLKFTEDNGFALVLLDENGAYAKTCAGNPVPPRGRMGWMRLSGDDGKPLAVPLHGKSC